MLPEWMELSDRGLHFIMAHEGLELVPYRDAVGVWTDGYGNTHGVIPNGPAITLDKAVEDLRRNVAASVAAVNRLVNVPLTQGQFDTLVDFDYNLGDGSFGDSTLLRLLNAGDYEGADHQFARWNQGAGRVLPGLVTRRADEVAVFEGR